MNNIEGKEIIETQGNEELHEQDNPDIAVQKRSKRYKKCLDCDEYYEVIDNQSNHSCIVALKQRVTKQQDQINNMVTKEEVADILKGYIPHDQFLNFVRATEKKFSELFHSMNTHEEALRGNKKLTYIKCPVGHKLNELTGTRLQSVSCDLCLKRALDTGNHTQRCEECNFDICTACETALQKVLCKNSHTLSVINPADYDGLQCNNCLVLIETTNQFSYRCKQCDYDLCQKCFSNSTKEKKSFFSR